MKYLPVNLGRFGLPAEARLHRAGIGAGRFGWFDVAGKMVQIEEMTECSLGNEMDETDGGECTIDEGTQLARHIVG